jgi:hypothetical protein
MRVGDYGLALAQTLGGPRDPFGWRGTIADRNFAGNSILLDFMSAID